MARMQAMDKITGKVSEIDVPVNGEVKFGSFSIVVRACATRPPEDTPENYAFVDIIDDYNINTKLNIFRGWMFSSSPALNAVEHPIYDIWLLKCYDGDTKGKHLLSEEELKIREEITKETDSENKKLPKDFKIPEIAKEQEVKSGDGEPIQLLPMLPPEKNEVKEVGTVEMKGLVDAELPENKVISLDQAQNDAAAEDSNAPKMLINIDNSLEDMVKNIEDTVETKPTVESKTEVQPQNSEVIAEVSIVKNVDDKVQEQELHNQLEKAADEEALRRQKAREALEALSAEARAEKTQIADTADHAGKVPENTADTVTQEQDIKPIEIREAPEVKAVEPVATDNVVEDSFGDDDIIIEEIEEDGMIEEE